MLYNNCCVLIYIFFGGFIMNVLVVNAGSSSLKYQLFDTTSNTVIGKGLCERIGIDGAITHKQLVTGKEYAAEVAMPDHTAAMKYVVEALVSPEHGCVKSMSEIEAVGHRVVHGGAYFSESVLLTEEVYDILRRGSEEARAAAAETLSDVRRAMRINYFEDRELIERQAAEFRAKNQ